ncbi:metallophosphoesterase family protein [Egicoccus halophilus]|uniref:Phosphoesterase n=1 Tax=Egicoccus halophilus TaxID=1670830 RepID=A0A8J3EVN4_9ACTN|nr:metallophosphoesterase family protein [Egicoccus halophilus]GGI08496.1 phosphoesterase [Egicoccus halophilus]
MRVVVTADTHLRRDWPNRRLPAAALRWLARADVILHAGDITQAEHLERFGGFAPVHAVLGNNDRELVGALPETLELTLAGVRIGMIHDSGQARGRSRRLSTRFPDADLVVFGHSHVPVDAPGEGDQRLFNPGSPTERRRMPHRTIGVLDLAEGEILDARIEVVDD